MYNNMHAAAQRKIAALRRAAGATQRQIFLPFSIIVIETGGYGCLHGLWKIWQQSLSVQF